MAQVTNTRRNAATPDAVTGLIYYRARWYDPRLGRFISEDPLGFAAGDTNLSRYVGNSMPNAVDPTGLEEMKIDESGDVWVYSQSWWFGINYDSRRWKVGTAFTYTTPRGAEYLLIQTDKVLTDIDGNEYRVVLHCEDFEEYIRWWFTNVTEENTHDWIIEHGFIPNRSELQIRKDPVSYIVDMDTGIPQNFDDQLKLWAGNREVKSGFRQGLNETLNEVSVEAATFGFARLAPLGKFRRLCRRADDVYA